MKLQNKFQIIFLIILIFIVSCSIIDSDYKFKCKVVEKYSNEPAANVIVRLKARENTGIMESKQVDDCTIKTNSNGEGVIEYSNKTDYFSVDVNLGSEAYKRNNDYFATSANFSDPEFTGTYTFNLEPGAIIDFKSDLINLKYDSIIIDINTQRLLIINELDNSARGFAKLNKYIKFNWTIFLDSKSSKQYNDSILTKNEFNEYNLKN